MEFCQKQYTALVTKPPSVTRKVAGSVLNISCVSAKWMSLPNSRPTLKQPLMKPASRAMARPLGKLKSLTAAFFSSSLSEAAFIEPATLLVTFGGFLTNAVYCFYQNQKNKTWGDYAKKSVWGNNLLFCLLAGALWYSQFFGLSLGKSFFEPGSSMMTLAFCILMAFNVIFSNVWGIILKEWKGCSPKTICVLVVGLVVLIFSTFLPKMIE